jgi:tripartite-type tricarboxylate transporter receptor subunit TctC
MTSRHPQVGQGGTAATSAGFMPFTAIIRYLLCVLAVVAPAGSAHSYPDRPVRLIVTFAPGGAPDVIARAVAAQVERQLGQAVTIDNRAGANGIVGTQAVAHAPADGYTLLHASASFVVNPSVYRRLPYDIWRDFAPVANLGIGIGYLLLVNKDLPVSSVADLIVYAKNNPLSYGSPGAGNTLHLASELFNVKAGISMQHVPFRGTAPALNALLAGTIQAMFIPPAAALAYVESGQLKALGFTGNAPLPELPAVPLIKDSVPEFRIEGAWHGWFAPARTPVDIVARLNGEVRKALKVPKVRDFVLRAGYVPDDKSPEQYRAFLREELERYAEAARAAQIELQ